ncbi:MAG TPA: tetratricopeptide repeat protein [Nitrososphaerales archaeon]|nr:tetratricopeptide repeat protein [Nitrososphaerales archaeon]
MSQGERRLAAVMFTDMVGYTALTQSNESQALQVLDRHNRLLRPFFHKFHGREVKTIGDSFLVEFDSALDATDCAIEIQRYLHDYNLSSRDEWRITLRIGIHLGDVVRSGDDILGDAVNIASRIQPLADPEGICVSDQVWGQVRNKISQGLVKLAPQDLKNISFPVDVYRVVMPWEKQDTESPAQLDSKRIAVLPFVSLSPDPNDEYFADGLTEELITRVSLVKGLEVIARTSAMNYKKKEKNVSQIGKELKVGTVLEGSVRKAGNRIRVSAQLIDANTEGHMWAENYDRNLDDVFEVQSSVAENVAGALKVKLLQVKGDDFASTANPEAYTLYLKAMQLYHEGTESDYRDAIAWFEKALAKDPNFVRAYAGLAHAWRGVASFEDYVGSNMKGEAAARRALELAPGSAEAHAAMASIDMALDRFEEGRQEMEKAVQLNPNLFQAYLHLGEIHCTFGRFDEGIANYQKAFNLDPLSVHAGYFLAHALRVAGRVDDALDLLRRLDALHPRNLTIYDGIATCYFQTREFDKCAELIEAGLRADPDNPLLRVDRGCMYAFMGKRKEAEDDLLELSHAKGDATRDNAQFFIRVALGDIDEAIEALMRQAGTHAWYFMIKYDPLLEALRKDPRFEIFCKKVGIAD